jgi:hypothetical protein
MTRAQAELEEALAALMAKAEEKEVEWRMRQGLPVAPRVVEREVRVAVGDVKRCISPPFEVSSAASRSSPR